MKNDKINRSEKIMKKKVVIRSINNIDKSLCIDIFRRKNYSFGFEEYRRDKETNEGWYEVGFYRNKKFINEEEAYNYAYEKIIWLKYID